MRISDWSSDVCSSDLPHLVAHDLRHAALAETVEDQQGTIADALHQHVDAVGVALDLAEPATPARRLLGAAAAVAAGGHRVAAAELGDGPLEAGLDGLPRRPGRPPSVEERQYGTERVSTRRSCWSRV